MRPIKLYIKGLNSFNESQTIDFDVLAKHGLFGVFGPTGSGKSTILDAMTIALYGKTSRNSNNFIHTSCDQMQVAFTFSIQDKVYEVTRSYRRNKQGAIHASKPTRLMLGEEILEESTTKVDEKCIEVIGLKFEDFIRTVVLPQGKFSEFIKLKGKDRRDMLERLFNLNRYGDELSKKLNKKIRYYKDEETSVHGELKAYSNVSKAEKLLKESAIKALDITINEKRSNEKVLIEKVKETQKVKELQDNLNEENNFLITLEEKQPEIETIEDKVKIAKKSAPIISTYNQVEALKESTSQLQNELDLHTKDLRLINEKKEVLILKFDKTQREYDEKMPFFQEKYHQLEEGIQLVENQIILKNKSKVLQTEINTLKTELLSINEIKNKLVIDYDVSNQKIEGFKKTIKALHVNSDMLEFSEQGYLLEIEVAGLRKSVLEQTTNYDELFKQLNELNEKVNELNTEKDRIIIQEYGLTLENYQMDKEALNQEKGSIEKSIHQKKLQMEKLSTLETQLKHIKEDLLESQSSYEMFKKNQKIHYAKALQEDLKEGAPCPVCGSLHHESITVEEVSLDHDIEKHYNKLLNSEELLLKQFIEEKGKRQPENLEEKLQIVLSKINTLDTAYKESVEKEKQVQMKQLISKELEMLLKDQDAKRIVLKQLKETLEQSREALNEKEHQLNHLISKISDESFEKLKSRLREQASQRDKIENELVEEENNNKLIMNQNTSLENQINEKNQKVSLVELDLTHTRNTLEIDEKKLSMWFGENRLLKEYKSQLESDEKELKETLRTLSDEKLMLQQQEQSLHIEQKSKEALLLDQRKRLIKANELLQQHLLENMLTIDDLKDYDPTIIEAYETLIEKYYIDLLSRHNRIKEIKSELNSRTTTDEILNKMTSELKLLHSAIETETSEKAVLIKEVEVLNSQLEMVRDLIKKQDVIEKQLSLLSELEKLFRGKKFVEFVASYQLRYVSKEASERLFEITSGQYGLEVDDDGLFIVRDYKNGGVTRSTSTLSGGESFLVSLSLALSLSSQIQLKGNAPLELFFLDEGFGTLDDHVLDIVMTALEKIHHKYLSIGIISHVEKIKNRVPIKLNVTPSIIGEHGTTVKIERT